MSRWFRVHDDLVDDPKIQLLDGDMVKSLLNLWCLASQNGGVLPPMKEMSFKLRMKPQQVATTIAELSLAGLIDRDGDEYRPHNWDKRQYKSDTDTTAAERSKRYRAKHRDGNAPVTRDDGDSRHASSSVSVSGSVSSSLSKKEETSEKAFADPPDFDEFWAYWPNKVGKPAALKAYSSAIKRGAKPSDIVDGVRNYIRDKPPDRSWLNPATFLNQNRWEDRPAPVAKPLTAHQQRQLESKEALDALRNASGRSDFGVQRYDPSNGQAGVHSGVRGAIIDLSAARDREGHEPVEGASCDGQLSQPRQVPRTS